MRVTLAAIVGVVIAVGGTGVAPMRASGASIFPPPRAFQVPKVIAGIPVHPYGEAPFTSSADSVTGVVSYQWWVRPPGVGGRDPGGSYLVRLYTTTQEAQSGTAQQRALWETQLPEVPAGRALTPDEWIAGGNGGGSGHCAYVAGLSWRNIAIRVQVYDDEVALPACIAWERRMLARLLMQARHYAATHPA